MDCTYFRLITATFEIVINDKFSPELSLLATQNETQFASSEREHDDISSASAD